MVDTHMNNSDSSTSVSLLGRIQQNCRDDGAWQEFVARYGKRIFQWCENRGLAPNDAEDVTQEVLVRMCKYLRDFKYDQRLTFTGYLRRATENAVADFFSRNNGNEKAEGGSSAVSWLNTVEARDDLNARLQEAFDLELLERAMSHIQRRVNNQRWEAWYQTMMQLRDNQTVAAELGMSVASLYAAKHHVGKLLQEEIKRLENPESFNSKP